MDISNIIPYIICETPILTIVEIFSTSKICQKNLIHACAIVKQFVSTRLNIYYWVMPLKRLYRNGLRNELPMDFRKWKHIEWVGNEG